MNDHTHSLMQHLHFEGCHLRASLSDRGYVSSADTMALVATPKHFLGSRHKLRHIPDREMLVIHLLALIIILLHRHIKHHVRYAWQTAWDAVRVCGQHIVESVQWVHALCMGRSKLHEVWSWVGKEAA